MEESFKLLCTIPKINVIIKQKSKTLRNKKKLFLKKKSDKKNEKKFSNSSASPAELSVVRHTKKNCVIEGGFFLGVSAVGEGASLPLDPYPEILLLLPTTSKSEL